MLTSRDCFLPGKQLCWSSFLILSISKFLRAPFLKNICELLLLKRCSRKWETLKLIIRSFNFTLKTGFFNINVREVHDWFPMKFVLTHNISLNQKNVKSSRKEYAMWTRFYFWPMRVWLWLVYKIYRELLSLTTFLRLHSNSKEVSYPSWQNTSKS